MEGFEGDSLAKNSLLMTCLENDQSFLSKLIPHKILEAIFCRNFVKLLLFRTFESHLSLRTFEFHLHACK